jgi:hypothetical protein
LATKQDTLGGKFPVILTNGMADYAEFSIGGLLSIQAETEGKSYFMDLPTNDTGDREYDRITEINNESV